jgi:hypothetical protein
MNNCTRTFLEKFWIIQELFLNFSQGNPCSCNSSWAANRTDTCASPSITLFFLSLVIYYWFGYLGLIQRNYCHSANEGTNSPYFVRIYIVDSWIEARLFPLRRNFADIFDLKVHCPRNILSFVCTSSGR